MALYRSPLTVMLWPSSFLKNFTPNAAVLFVDVAIQPEVRFIAKQNSLMKIRNNGNLVLGPFDDNLKALFRRESIHDELPNQTENKSLDSCKSVAILESEKDFNDDHREEITDFVQSIPGYQEDDEEDVDGMRCRRLWTVCVEESYLVDDKTDEDEDNNHNESSKGPSNADAFSALETAMKGYEQQSECCPTQLLLLKCIRDLAAKKRRCTMVQRKISGYFQQ
ncbi:uncharacterized protein TNCV_3003571 [Trichonephila clavipes]|nr:uncharacterized protein TNCV_3003571 [Trichonephila clavipes]